ncbi:iron-containing alcohol dehydrogenase [Pelosinus propionicus]|uniref:Alcohol dehydrogenase, class IV n=1 Tax=Pelosinus propionicus DSM 13327 TaxID=1123291 RepID=A0A1I4MX35_9FIRM|nr:iron-containing alcohol dehydrogenase [Pelosinus propionicus]SFM07884.1 Alcohol dehydrogenase, class IV [Pelosinus propionicus DSM 13327]
MWGKEIDLAQIVEIRTKTTVYFGIGAITKMTDIAKTLSEQGINKVVVVTGRGSHIKSGAWEHVKKALDAFNILPVLYSKVTSNPTVDQVDEAASAALEFGAQAVIAIGGGSPIDAGKSVAALIANPGKTARELYEYTFLPEKAVPIIAINLTHGTGTEANRFAVVSIPEKEYKPVLAYECLYPMYSIDDPALMTTLPPEQTAYVSVDAVNHAIEAATTKLGNVYAVTLAREVISLVTHYLPLAQEDPKNLEARYYLTYASMIAGASFDNGLLHFTHAMEHPLSGVKPDLPHGSGLGVLLPAVVKHIYPAKAAILADILSPIVAGLKGEAAEAETAYAGLKQWLKKHGMKQSLREEGFVDSDVERLTDLAFETPSLELLLSMAPVEGNRETVAAIYLDSL